MMDTRNNNPLYPVASACKLLLLVTIVACYNALTGMVKIPISFFILPLLLQYFYFLMFIRKGIGRLQTTEERKPQTEPCSVIIPFRNEARWLQANCKTLQQQDLPADMFEVIYVDDHSDDGSAAIIKDSGFTLVSLTEHEHGKKAAITRGIQEAKYDIIICSDADCTYQAGWLAAMLKGFSAHTGFLSGPVAYDTSDKILFVQMLYLEFAGLVLTGAGLIGNNEPTIANGANAAYRKNLFLQTGGFSGSVSASGDDEFVMQKIHAATEYSVQFCADAAAVVKTAAPASPARLFKQRSRWASKSLMYNPSLLSFVLIPSFLFFIADVFLWLAVLFYPGMVVLSIRLLVTLVKALGEYLVLERGRHIFPGSINVFIHLFTSMVHSLYIVISTLKGVLAPYNWKGRTVK